jgi:predicted dehydrogenase
VEKIKIGFIGAGGIARHHVSRLSKVPEAQIVAMADPSETSLARMREERPQTSNCTFYSDYQEMLEQESLDAVQIHTPHTLHFEQAMDCLARDLPLLIEKPMVTSTEDAKTLIEAAEGQIVAISYQRHYQPTYRYIHQAIQEGKLGELQYVSALQSQGWYRSQRGKWRQDPALSGGGQLNDSGSHLIDILFWTTGLQPEEVYASIEYYDTQVDIDSAITIRFRDGAQGTLSIVGNSPFWWEDFSIWGSQAGILYRNGTLYYQAVGKEMQEVTDLPDGSDPDRNFVNAILGKEEVGSPPECGLKVISFTEACWRSAKEGHAIQIQES